MLVDVSKIEIGIAKYLDENLLPKLPVDGWKKAVAGAAIGLWLKKSGTGNIDKIKDSIFLKMLGVIDDTGAVDIDEVKGALEGQIMDTGMKVEVPVIGTLTFHKVDIDQICEYIKRS